MRSIKQRLRPLLRAIECSYCGRRKITANVCPKCKVRGKMKGVLSARRAHLCRACGKTSMPELITMACPLCAGNKWGWTPAKLIKRQDLSSLKALKLRNEELDERITHAIGFIEELMAQIDDVEIYQLYHLKRDLEDVTDD